MFLSLPMTTIRARCVQGGLLAVHSMWKRDGPSWLRNNILIYFKPYLDVDSRLGQVVADILPFATCAPSHFGPPTLIESSDKILKRNLFIIRQEVKPWKFDQSPSFESLFETPCDTYAVQISCTSCCNQIVVSQCQVLG